MKLETLLIFLITLSIISYFIAMRRAVMSIDSQKSISRLHSLPTYHGYYAVICSLVPPMIIIFLWLVLEQRVIATLLLSNFPDIKILSQGEINLFLTNVQNTLYSNIYIQDGMRFQSEIQQAAIILESHQSISRIILSVFAIAVSIIGIVTVQKKINQNYRARNKFENAVSKLLMISSLVAIFTTVGIVFSVLFESFRFFAEVSFWDFIFGTEWSPQTALRDDQVGSSGSFGILPLFVGTMLITIIAMLVAGPIGLMTAIDLGQYATPRFRNIAKPLLEVLAGIPTVVYGFFAALTLAPFLRNWGETVGLNVASESALAAGMVMGIMIIPLISSLSDDAINAVPTAMSEGALGLGSTESEVIKKVVLPAALPGIVGGFLLAISRAIGETMIVVMAAGLSANLTVNPLEAVTTVTVQIVTLLVGDQEFDSAKTLAAFALGLVLFVVTLGLNVIGLYIVRKYREQYE